MKPTAQEQNNLLIARFEGYETFEENGYTMVHYSDDNERTHVDLWYHTEWRWLQPVIAKLRKADPTFSTNHMDLKDAYKLVVQTIIKNEKE